MQYIQSYGFLFGVVLSEVQTGNVTSHDVCVLNFGAGIIFLTLAHPVYKMWIIQKPNTLDFWNKLHFEEEKTESIYRV